MYENNKSDGISEEEADRKHIEKIITALKYYGKHASARVTKTEQYLESLPVHHQKILSRYKNHLQELHCCIEKNQIVIKKMLRENILCSNGEDINGSTLSNQNMEYDGNPMIKISNQDMENAQSTLKLIARDWSIVGVEEREQSYKPIIDAIEEFFPPAEYEINEIKILVPGAGLGRLAYELACRGYDCEGNEFSYFMLIASHFVLNQCAEENKFTLYPWIHQFVNNLHMEDQITAIQFPDVCPAKNPPKGNFAMAAGDFLDVYKDENSYNCVATCFFIDCANNIVDFIETIYKILVPGGIWVNLGPLLYHYSDIQGENSIEPTYENLVFIIESVGFEIIRNQTGIRTKYAQNPKSMLKSEYESIFWICRKPVEIQEQQQQQEEQHDQEINDDEMLLYNNGNDELTM